MIYRTIPYHTIPYYAAVRYRTVLCNTVLYCTIPYRTVQWISYTALLCCCIHSKWFRLGLMAYGRQWTRRIVTETSNIPTRPTQYRPIHSYSYSLWLLLLSLSLSPSLSLSLWLLYQPVTIQILNLPDEPTNQARSQSIDHWCSSIKESIDLVQLKNQFAQWNQRTNWCSAIKWSIRAV
jgi:hypothetical protein